jgi:repressor LexA
MKRSSNHGGYRPGAGRKSGQGPYGESTVVVRIPRSRVNDVRAYLAGDPPDVRSGLPAASNEDVPFPASTLRLPLIGRVAAGQPIGADALVEREVDVDRHLFRPRPDYLLRVQGDSMRDAGILDRDLIAVHRTSVAMNGQIVVARIDGEVTVKRYKLTRNRIVLLPENPDYAPIVVDPHTDDFAIEGLFVGSIRTS